MDSFNRQEIILLCYRKYQGMFISTDFPQCDRKIELLSVKAYQITRSKLSTAMHASIGDNFLNFHNLKCTNLERF